MAEFTEAPDLEELAGGVVICATHRLARRLRERHHLARRARGQARWAPLDTLTSMPGWRGATRAALLAGEIDARQAPRLALSPLQERLLWERVIAADADAAGEPAENALFDREGLAAAAGEANDLMEVWVCRSQARPASPARERAASCTGGACCAPSASAAAGWRRRGCAPGSWACRPAARAADQAGLCRFRPPQPAGAGVGAAAGGARGHRAGTGAGP